MNAPNEAPSIAQFALARQREIVAALRADMQMASPPHAYFVVYEKQVSERPEVVAFLQWMQQTFRNV